MVSIDPSRYLRWYGRPQPPLPVRSASAGLLSLLIEGVDIRRVTHAGTAVLDRLFVAIRDVDWGTLPALVDEPPEVATDPGTGQTVVTFRARHEDATIRFAWRGRITVGPGENVSMEMDGVAEADFRYARIGLCALLPARSMAGRAVRAGGAATPTSGSLPDLVAPQLVVDGVELPIVPACRELEVTLPDVVVHHRFEGDDFELEDQRNWTDDSFKAYSLMAGQPYPRTAHRGQRFWQRVSVSVRPREGAQEPDSGTGPTPVAGTPRVDPVVLPNETEVTLTTDRLRWPGIGLGDSSDPAPLDATEAAALAPLRLDHVRVAVRLGAQGWQERLQQATTDALAIGARLELALSIDEPAMTELGRLRDLLRDVPVARVLVLHAPTQATAATPAGWLSRAGTVLRDALPGARWITGTDGDFAELNRDRPMPRGVDAADGVCYALNPQIHASDEMSMAETLPAQGRTVATAASWFPGGDVCVSPVTLRQRFNPAALSGDVAGPASTDEPADPKAAWVLPSGVDRRQRSLFGAAWTIGSVAALAVAGATSVTWYETAGWRGLMERSVPPTDRPGWDPVIPGEIYPMYHVFRDLGERQTMVPVRCQVTADRDVVALGMRTDQGVRLLIANLTCRPIRSRIVGLPSGAAESLTLDETTSPSALGGVLDARTRAHPVVEDGATTIDLLPFASVRLDVTR